MKRTVLSVAALLLLLTSAPPALLAQDVSPEARKKMEALLEKLQVKPAPAPPAWYANAGEPLFRFVQISDIHLNRRVEPLLLAALAFVDREVRPAFAAITGDNAGRSTLEAQKHLKTLLDENLEAPCFIVRGDNWARNFAPVFGSTRQAFECGGVRFVFTGLDRDDEGKGVGRFAGDTWDWMEKELANDGAESVVLFLHENVQPPVFLDAPRLDRLLENSPAAAATFTGHLHYDLEFRAGRVHHVLAPGLGPHPAHGFKVGEVHPRFIAVRTVEWDGARYAWTQKYQRIELPRPARQPSAQAIENLRALPARETTFDIDAKDAGPALLLQLMAFAKRVGLGEEAERIRGEEEEAF